MPMDAPVDGFVPSAELKSTSFRSNRILHELGNFFAATANAKESSLSGDRAFKKNAPANGGGVFCLRSWRRRSSHSVRHGSPRSSGEAAYVSTKNSDVKSETNLFRLRQCLAK